MQSHAHRLLGKELQRRAGPKGIQAQPVNNNLLQWEAKVEGLKNTLWEGAVLQLTLHFSEALSVPPTVKFNIIPFHPNVDKVSGKPCISYLDNRQEWRPGLSVGSILLSIQVMLSNPVLEGAVNPEAADMLRSNPASYHKVVLDCVQASQEMESEPAPQHQGLLKRICFEEYLEAWRNMATTKAVSWMRNEPVEDFTKRSEAFAINDGSAGRESLSSSQHEEFKAIMYGPAWKPQKTEAVSEGRQARIDQLRKIYLLRKTPDMHRPLLAVQKDSLGSQGFSGAQDRRDYSESEVDKLVAWTHSLSFEELEE